MRSYLAIIAAILTGCAGAPRRAADCTERPQWTTTDSLKREIGIHVCFQRDGALTYVLRVLPPAPPAVAPVAVPPAAETFAKIDREIDAAIARKRRAQRRAAAGK
ncbi:MAG: hypothetical protein V4510_09665 [bacterium]